MATPRRPCLGALLSHLSRREHARSQKPSLTLTPFDLSGRSTPVPLDAPPSEKCLSSARRQVRAEQRRLFPTTDFTYRVSHFDPASDYRDFHGFFNLFWIGLAIMAMTTILRNIRDTGSPFRVHIWTLFTVKLWHLAIADFLMVASTAVSVLLHTMLVRRAPAGGTWTWARGGMALQSIYQVLWLAFWVAVPFLLDWTWTSQVFLLIHTMVLLMKMHSYAFYNGHLSETEKRLRGLDNPKTADTAPAYLYPTADNPMGAVVAGASSSTISPSSALTTATANSNGNGNGATTHRRTRPRSSSKLARGSDDADSSSSGHDDSPAAVDEISELRSALARELTSPMGNVTYPRNLTWSNYLDYLLCPTLCYEIEYPRLASINWHTLVSKIVATFGCIFLLTVTSEEYILPVLVEASSRLAATASATESLLILAETVSWLLFPFTVSFLLTFLVIFEYILGAFAEITRFADRHFYSDWWNSTDWMEFSREWNVPVYSFLRRHVYSASRPHIGKVNATVITFLISAIGHEIVMACIAKKIRGYGFVCQMMQLPLMVVQQLPVVKGRGTMNNVIFWSSMIMGLSMVGSSPIFYIPYTHIHRPSVA
jgi:sterol O-acyltransferase